MNSAELVPVQERTIDGVRRLTVLATDLHSFLLVSRDLPTWIKPKIKNYGFVEGVDYEVFHRLVENPTGGRPRSEYVLTLDMAKELAMVEKSIQGRQVRRYFIECERRLLEAMQPVQPQLPMAMPHTAPAPFNESRLIGSVINGAKNALQHILKDAKEHILTAFDRQRADLKVLSETLLERDRQIYDKLNKVQHDVRRAHSDALVVAEQLTTTSAKPNALSLAAGGMVEIGRVYAIAAITDPIPRRGKLSADVSRSLDAFCKKHGYAPRSVSIGQREVTYWPETAVVAWLEERGRTLIAAHIARWRPRQAPLLHVIDNAGE